MTNSEHEKRREYRKRWKQKNPNYQLKNASERNIWHKMINRCTKPSDPSFKYYGDRGIVVCEQWLSFEQFFKDMGPKPSKLHSIDRIDSDKGYFPENCRWATQIDQQNNRTNNRLITFKGETHTIAEWARKTGILVSRLYERARRGWSPEDILDPTNRSRRKNEI